MNAGKEDGTNKSATILVVEKDYSTRSMLRFLLELSGYRVAEAASGEEAVEGARRARPDLILMDMGLPALGGFAATSRIREELSGVRVVAVTTYDTPIFRGAAHAIGCSECVTRPIDFPRLLDLIGRLLLRRAAAGERRS